MYIDPKKWEASDDTLRNREVSAANAALTDQPNPSAKRVRFNARPQIFDAQQSGMFTSIHFSIIVLYFTIKSIDHLPRYTASVYFCFALA